MREPSKKRRFSLFLHPPLIGCGIDVICSWFSGEVRAECSALAAPVVLRVWAACQEFGNLWLKLFVCMIVNYDGFMKNTAKKLKNILRSIDISPPWRYITDVLRKKHKACTNQKGKTK